MNIRGENLGKKFGKNWIFRGLNVGIHSGDFLVITGPNGSGKSTLLQILSGFLSPSEGTLYHDDKQPDMDLFRLISYSGPYVELPEELTFGEFLQFHSTFRKQLYATGDICKKSLLPKERRIGEFSTGMKQRAQLCTAFYFENEIIFMDEPTSNLDNSGFEWWKMEIEARNSNTPLILASNHSREIGLAGSSISIKDKINL